MSNAKFRGSRKHVLDLVEKADFVHLANDLVRESGVTISQQATFRPKGYIDPAEMELRDFGPLCLPDVIDWKIVNNWWPGHPAKSPQWDLLITCMHGGREGLVLVEAKAHEAELHWEGKELAKDASNDSIRNHRQIGACISGACQSLNEKLAGFNMGRDSHYQLANRIAFAWKLAQCGLPAVLLYLGFTGDESMANVGIPFRDGDHWQRLMGAYMHGVLPLSLPGMRLDFAGTPLVMLVKSLPIEA
jgi:hypothetical protein